MIVDDHAVVREGLAAVLGMQSDMSVAGAVATAEELLAAYPAALPDVVLLDLRLPGTDGIEALRLLRQRHPRARVLMLSSHEGDEAIYRALKGGALGYVFKKMKSADLVETIRQAAEGRVPIASEVAARLGERVAYAALSAREVEVLSRIARGESNKEIGDALGISASTVKNHVNNILAKLGAADRTQAVTIGLQRGVI